MMSKMEREARLRKFSLTIAAPDDILATMLNVRTFRLLALAIFLCTTSVKAGLAEFTFTGTGVNGALAAGHFTVDENALQPNYFANGNIYPSLSLTISNISGGGSVSFNLTEISSSWFSVDANGVPFLLPLGSHNFGPPEQNHYDLGGGIEPQLKWTGL
jgi:hypothetical protein